MPVFLMILLAIHVLSSIFWAGSTFTLARTGGAGSQQFFRPQMGAATVAFLSGATLMGLYHGSWLSGSETVLGIGIVTAIAAAGVQGALRKKTGDIPPHRSGSAGGHRRLHGDRPICCLSGQSDTACTRGACRRCNAC